MKIAFVIYNFKKNGGTRYIAEMSKYLTDQGHEVFFILPRNATVCNWDYKAKIIQDGKISKIYYLDLLKYFSSFKIPSVNFDVVVATYCFTAFNAWKLSKEFIYLVQGNEPSFFESKNKFLNIMLYPYRMLAKKSYKLTDALITNSAWTKEKILSDYNKNSFIVTPGVDRETFLPKKNKVNKKSIDLLFVGRNGRGGINKGLDIFIKVAERLYEIYNVKIKIASPNIAHLNTSIPYEIYNPENDIELAKIYNSSDIFISPSSNEGFGLPALESMSCGLPVVLYNSGGVSEYAENRVNALIVDKLRTEDFVKVLEELIENKGLRQNLIKNGIETAEKYKWDEIGRKFMDSIIKYKKLRYRH